MNRRDADSHFPAAFHAAILAFITMVVATGCRRQPPDPIRLRLELAKTNIQVGEYPWYRFSITNIGRKAVPVDPFLCQQSFRAPWPGEERLSWIDVEITDVDGKWIYHNDRRRPHYWTNECGGQTGCACEGDPQPHTIPGIRGGQTLFAAASMVGPVKPTPKNVIDHRIDPRDLPRSGDDLPLEKREALAGRWKLTVERQGYLLGDPTFVSTMTAKDTPYFGYPKALYPGYRVFDDIGVDKPGRYRMRVVYHPFGGQTTYEQVRKYRADSDAKLEKIYGWPEETRVFFYASNWVDFEVVAPPFPEHLFSQKILRTKCDKLRNDWMRRSLQDAQVWQGDPLDKELAEHSLKELPPECR